MSQEVYLAALDVLAQILADLSPDGKPSVFAKRKAKIEREVLEIDAMKVSAAD